MKFKVAVLYLLIFGVAAVANAQDSTLSTISAYRSYIDADNISINVPTVVEIPIDPSFIERSDVVVLDKTTNSFEPHFFQQEILIDETPLSITTVPNVSGADYMIDKDVDTYADFLLPEDAQGQVEIILTSAKPITSSSFSILLDDNVALPTSVEIRANVDGENRIIVANKEMNQQLIRFPQTTSNEWRITFKYGQPLRISELRLSQDDAVRSSIRAVRFLAQPDRSYRVYFDSDRFVYTSVGEAGDLASAQDVLTLSVGTPQSNPDYVIADTDSDGVSNISDNCVFVPNADQQDLNTNGRGDACDDFDQDGLINTEDNCPNNPNRDQSDEDEDGIGDACDATEGRITERYPWIPWVGIGFAAIVLVVLMTLTARATYVEHVDDKDEDQEE